ncbi:Methionine aminopeptidase [Listeria grayi]|uniref:Methionine aminopeptidase n=2 Tax=Listeria grayi TaxID=1641 RepID=A0A829R302_LISGR|nr:type I methionyl aminopeptidase [Listeria grayi]EUJ26419.1 methionine aminopeptidase [Listeria grayi FSL F6-1183]MBC1921775.1 type I methionyl aminopeptidase [Listeria grayi]STY45234.1 Methionine aminopeptidase [Listeria grayi]VEI31849.1 Methionine aminopeptidase [Listeria grayi]
MIIKTEEELAGIRQAGKVFAEIREKVIAHVAPGITTKELDDIAKEAFLEAGAISAPKEDFQFPGYACISVGDEVAHGIPGDRVIQDGELVNIDVSGAYNGYYVDTGKSLIAGSVTEKNSQAAKLVQDTEIIFNHALKVIKTGTTLQKLGRTVEEKAEELGYKVLENLTGHGVGHSLRDKPDYVYNVDAFWDKQKLKEGQVIAFEPFISTKGIEAEPKNNDGWTLTAGPDSLVCQLEHSLIVRKDGVEIVTA